MPRLLALCLAAAISAGCNSPTEASGVCGPCAAPGTVPPSAESVAAAIAEGQRQARATCPAVTDASPAVAWWQCPTWITNGITSPASQGHGVCAAGMTSTDGRTIFISLANPSNVLPLVIWESRNAAWILAGCGEQAY